MTKFLKGECGLCGGHIEFPAEAAGETIDCPHCGKPTELLLSAPPQSSTLPVKTIVYTLVAILILAGGLVLAMLALKRAQRLAANREATHAAPAEKAAPAKPLNPFAEIGFRASAVKLEKMDGSALVYAVGTVRNLTNRQRFDVKVELDVFDAGGQRLNSETNRPSDYQKVIEANSEWRFHVLMLDKKAVSAKLISIKEQN